MNSSNSNRSPSPLMSSRSQINPRKSSEGVRDNIAPSRKSFNGAQFNKPFLVSPSRNFNPFTPANSPAEYSRGSSFSKDSFHDYEQKENEQEPNTKSTRLKSPTVVKGSKTFMSPTISTASKINASPRKKVLGERNETVRTSASLSSGKFHFYSLDPSELGEALENVLKPETQKLCQIGSAMATSNVNSVLHNESTEHSMREPAINHAAPENCRIESAPNMVVLSPEITPNPPSKSTVSVPLIESSPVATKLSFDSNNGVNSAFLVSPIVGEPNHLPYDPKKNYLSPRPQFLHYKPKPRIDQGIPFEKDAVPESSSDAESTNKETGQSEVSNKESETSSSVEEVDSRNAETRGAQFPKENVEFQLAPKRKSGLLSKAFVLILVLSLTFPLATHSPAIIDTWYQVQISKIKDELHKVADLAREHFEDKSHTLKLKLMQSFEHLSLIISGFSKDLKSSPLKFKNMSIMQEYCDRGYEFEQPQVETFEKEEHMELVDARGMPSNEEEYDYEDITEIESDLELQEDSTETHSYMELEEHITENESGVEPEEEPEENFDLSPHVEGLTLTELAFEDSDGPGNNRIEAEQAQENVDVFSDVQDEPQTEQPSISTAEVETEKSTPELVKQILLENIVATSVCAAILLAAMIAVCIKPKNHPLPVNDQFSIFQSKTSNIIKPSISESGPVEYEMEGESEVSSLQSDSFYSKRGTRVADERKARKSNLKRDSEYTMGTASYGSFTSYSIVHSKQGDEEVVTPIRRSSRIKGKVTPS